MKNIKWLFSIAFISLVTLVVLINTVGAAPFAYITNERDNTVSVIDLATNSVIATVDVGLSPDGVAVTPDGKKVYVTNKYSTTVSVIDTSTNNVTATIDGFSGPWGVAITPDGTKAYITNSIKLLGSDNGPGNTVSVINTSGNTFIANISVGNFPHGVAVSPDGSRVYVTNEYSDSLSVIDTATNTVIATVPVGSFPEGVAVSPDGSKVYVVNANSNNVSVVNTSTNNVTASVSVEIWPIEVAVSPDGLKAYVTNDYSDTVSVIDTSTDKVIATVAVGTYPLGIAVGPDGKNVYVTNYGSNDVSVIDTSTNKITASISVGNNPMAFGLFISSFSPVQKIQQINTTIKDLITAGKLNKGQGNSLISKLDAAEKRLNNENRKAATNQLNAFVNEVKADVKTGKLSSINGQPLIDEAKTVINSIK